MWIVAAQYRQPRIAITIPRTRRKLTPRDQRRIEQIAARYPGVLAPGYYDLILTSDPRRIDAAEVRDLEHCVI